MAIISVPIENMNVPMSDVRRIVSISGLIWADDTKEMYVNYKIQYLKNDVDITQALNKEVRPIHIHNNMTVYQRNLEDFSKIPNPDFVDVDTTPTTLQYLEAPAYDYITQIFTEHPELIWLFLSGYILENWADGWFDNI
jgi:hypothetical protein